MGLLAPMISSLTLFPKGSSYMLARTLIMVPHTGGNQEGDNTSNIYIMSSHIDIATRSHDYGESGSSKARFAFDAS